jgi:indolepyruvate ferredoxin oxidoreductase beta subunit
VLQHLAVSPTLPDPADRARAIAAARTAALQDEAGTQFDAALRAHGAPARALREQPIRWMRKPRSTA